MEHHEEKVNQENAASNWQQTSRGSIQLMLSAFEFDKKMNPRFKASLTPALAMSTTPPMTLFWLVCGEMGNVRPSASTGVVE